MSSSSSLVRAVVMAMGTSAIAYGAWYEYNTRKKKVMKTIQESKLSNGDGSSTTTSTNSKNDVEDLADLEDVDIKMKIEFKEAAEHIRKVPSSRVTTEQKLQLYSLYKQATIGDAPQTLVGAATPTDLWEIMTSRTKYRQWAKLRNVPRSKAVHQYIILVQHILTSVDENSNSTTTTSNGQSSSSSFAPSVSRPVQENGGLDQDGANNNKIKDDPQSLFLLAASKNDISELDRLLKSKDAAIDINYADETGQTALHLAADKGAMDSVNLLLQAGANPNARDKDGISVLQAAVIANKNIDICRLLLQHGADPDLPDNDNDTPRSCATDDGSEALLFLFETTLQKQSAEQSS